MELSKDHLAYMNLGRRFWAACIDDITQQQQSESLMKYVQQWPHYIRAGIGAFLWGPNSSGKTHIGAALCKAIWGRYNITSYMITAEELKECWIDNSIAANPWSNERRVDRLAYVRFLLIDDLAKEYRTASGFAENKLGNLLRQRQKELKITSITSNMSPPQFRETYGESSYELLKESTIACKIEGDNMRERILKDIQTKIDSDEGQGIVSI